ncbi:MAG: hypothetical protein U5K74_11885 [Gemmatimonadaceae bacterium]|nr:hypothetical protein [Gemmatimonadaceae bacterium]
MPVDIPRLTADSQVEQRDRVLRISDARHASVCEIRVDEGIPFVRTTGRGTDGKWAEASQRSVLELFAADSPIATFLRTQGANPLRVLLTDLGAPSATVAGGET